MSYKTQVAAWWKIFVVMLAAAVVVAACSAPAAPVAMPEVTVEVSDAGISAPAEMPAGLVAVTVNNSTQAPTGPIFARLNEGVSQEQFMEALMADESGMAAIALVTLLGGAQAEAGESVRTVFDLKPGNHIALGFGEGPPQLANFTVAAGSGAAPAAPAAAVNAELLDFQFALPDQIKAGVQTWQIENKGGQWHEMVVVKLNEGVTADDLMAMMMSGEEPDGPPPFEQVAFWAPMSAGERAWMDVDLPAGEYTVLCFLPDFASDPPTSHLEHGMVRTLTVTE
jgi:hypothetical protein